MCFFVVDLLMVGVNCSLFIRWLILVDGCGGWLLVVGWRFAVVRCLLLVVGCSLLVASFGWLVVARFLLRVDSRLLLFAW